MIGGDGDHRSLELSDTDLLSVTESDIDSIIGIDDTPEITMNYRWKEGIPQYKIGNGEVWLELKRNLIISKIYLLPAKSTMELALMTVSNSRMLSPKN